MNRNNKDKISVINQYLKLDIAEMLYYIFKESEDFPIEYERYIEKSFYMINFDNLNWAEDICDNDIVYGSLVEYLQKELDITSNNLIVLCKEASTKGSLKYLYCFNYKTIDEKNEKIKNIFKPLMDKWLNNFIQEIGKNVFKFI